MTHRSRQTTRLLLVEDDPTHGELLRTRLGELSAQIEIVRTCEAAARALAAEQFDTVVLDVGLPDGSGFELQDLVRQRGNALPVVFVTSDDMAEHAVEAMRAGAVHYVVKRPGYLDRVRDAVAEALRGGSGSEPPASRPRKRPLGSSSWARARPCARCAG